MEMSDMGHCKNFKSSLKEMLHLTAVTVLEHMGTTDRGCCVKRLAASMTLA